MKKKGKRIGIVLSIVMILIMMMSVTSNAAMPHYEEIELDYAKSNDSITISRESILSGEVTQAQLSIIYNTIKGLEVEASEGLSEITKPAIKTTPDMIEISIGGIPQAPVLCAPTPVLGYFIYINGEQSKEKQNPISFQTDTTITMYGDNVTLALYKAENGTYYVLVYDNVKERLTEITEVDETATLYDLSATIYFEETSLVKETTSGMGTILGWVAKPFNALINGGWNSLLVLFAVGIAISGVLIAVKIIRKFIWGD